MKTIVMLSLMILIPLSNIFSQVSQQWVSTYNSSGVQNDESKAVTTDLQGNVYVTGLITLSGTNTDITTVKYNPTGAQQWAVTYSGPSLRGDVPVGIAVDDSGNVYVTGSSRDASNIADYITIKYNSAGVQQWAKIYTGPTLGNNFDEPTGIVIDHAGNIIVTGYSYNSGTYYDFLTIKYSPSGDSLWVTRSVGAVASPEDIPKAIFVDNSDNIYLTGKRIAGGASEDDIGTIKYDSAGNELWHAFYSSPGGYNDYAYSIAVTDSGNVYVTGYVEGPGSTRNYATVKYNPAGVEQWARTYNGPGNDWDEAYSVAVDHSGNAYITGYSYGAGTEGDATTIKYTPAGDTAWVKRYNGPSGSGWDEGITIRTDPFGNVYVAGNSYAPNGDILLIKYSPAGDSLWGFRYNGPNNLNDETKNMILDAQGNVYITGRTNTNTNGYNFITLKYGLPTTIIPANSNVPGAFSLSQNYPNPFNPMTKIKFDIPKAFNTKLVIYDILGKEVAILVNEDLKPGTYEVDFDAANLPSGTYFYRLDTDGISETKKMLLIK